MTINKKRLKRIIKEEVQKYLSEWDEEDPNEDPYAQDSGDWDDDLTADERDRMRTTRDSWDEDY
jgi:hypothetical protein